ncbi:MAG: DUF2062 domain-containing protein [Thermoanaerobaculia bacterium]
MNVERSPSPLLRASVHLHWLAGVVLLAAPRLWKPVVATLVADHLTLLAGSLWPRSSWVGRNLRRLPPGEAEGRIALTFDDGPDPEGTPAVLEVLARHRARASFFLIGERAAAAPELVAAIRDGGHTVENHSWRHPNGFCLLPPAAARREIVRCQEVLTRLAGAAPRWFRAPAGLRNPWLDRVLRGEGLELASWTRRGFDTVAGDPQRVSRRLLDGLAAGDVLLLHDRAAAGRAALPAVLAAIESRGLAAVPLPATMDRAERPRRRGVAEAGRDLWVRLRTEGGSPRRQAAAIALGVAIGCLPFYGTHLVLCFALAGWLGLNRLNAYLAAHVNNPLTAPFLLTAAYLGGHRVLHGAWPATRPELSAAGLWRLGGETILGSFLLALVLAPLAGLAAWALARRGDGDPFDRLAESVAARYAATGIGHWELARGKLRGDPLYREIVRRLEAEGGGGRLVDLGCGRGLVLALLAGRHRGPLHGVERSARIARVARRALGEQATIETADLATWTPTEPARVVLLLDVLHYLDRDAQEALLTRAAAMLEPGGLLLVREADRAGGLAFTLTRAAERAMALLRGHWRQRFTYRSADEWADLLADRGLATEVADLSRGTPFANRLVAGRRGGRAAAPGPSGADPARS